MTAPKQNNSQELDNRRRGLGAGEAGMVLSSQAGVARRPPPRGWRQVEGALETGAWRARHEKHCPYNSAHP